MRLIHHITTKVLTLTGLIAMLALPTLAVGQVVVKMGEYAGCSNTEIGIPIGVENFEDVAALTLYIKVNTDQVEFVGVENINEVFLSGDFFGEINLQSQVITLTWFSMTPVNLDDGIMCSIRVLLKGDFVNLNFQNECEIGRSDLSVIDNVEYRNGTLAALNNMEVDPVSQSLIEGSKATITVIGLPGQVTCQWQVGQGEDWTNLTETSPYSGTQTPQLDIQPVSAGMTNYFYRCLLTSNSCSEGSLSSELLVTPNGVGGWNGNIESAALLVYPNPVASHLNCTVNADLPSAEWIVVTIAGTKVLYQQLGDLTSGQELLLNTADLNQGIYIIKLMSRGKLVAVQKFLRN